MDVDRSIRFSIPPFVFILSLMVGILTSKGGVDYIKGWISPLEKTGLGGFITAIAAGGSLVIAGGFLISVIGYLLLRAALALHHKFISPGKNIGCGDYVSPEDFDRLAKTLKLSETSLDYAKHGHSLLAWLSYGPNALNEEMRDWFLRRWNNILVHVHSIVALMLALVFRVCVIGNIQCATVCSSPAVRLECCSCLWIVGSLLLIFMLAINCWLIRRESNKMWCFLVILYDEGLINMAKSEKTKKTTKQAPNDGEVSV